MDRITKVAVQRVHVAAVPSDLDGVADRALDAAGRGHVALGDFGIKPLGHGVDVPVVGDRQQNGVAQELVTLDVRGYADLVQNFRHGQLVAVLRDDLRAHRVARRLQHTADENRLVKRLDEEEREPAVKKFLLHLLALECPRDEERRVGAAGVLGLVALLDRDRVQVRHERIQQNGLRMNGQKGFQGLGAVLLTDGHGNAFGFQRTAAHSGHLRVRVGHYKFDFFHRHISSIHFELRVPRA